MAEILARRRLLSLCCPAPEPRAGAAPAEALRRLALWCQQFSPLTAADPPDGVLIDITGCAHLFGGEAGLKALLARRVPGAKLAVADTAAAAWALARYGTADSEDLTPLPVAALRLEPATVARLRRVGVQRIGELAVLPRAELTAGFGPAPVLRLAQAFGQAPEALGFICAPPDWQEIEPYAEPICAPAQLLAALARLAVALCARLLKGGRGATSLVARFYRVDRACLESRLGFAAPCRDAMQIGRLLKEKLADIDPGFGIEALSLTAAATEPVTATQRGIEREPPDYSLPIDTLLNRLSGRIWRVAPRATHIPDHAARRIPLTLPPVPWSRPRHPRPLKLLKRPDAIIAIAPVPDDPPAQFAWRGRAYRIRRATGPERIAREWWRHEDNPARPEHGHVRDYYAVEDTEGTRFWLFRTGLHGGAQPVRWFLHGFF